MPKLHTSLESMGFTPNTLKILKSGKIANAGDLLELGVDCKGPIIEEIHKKLYEYFGKEDNDKTDLPMEHNADFHKLPEQDILPESEIYVGMAVAHKNYGDGKIFKIGDDRGYIKVAFSNSEKEFLFQGCFERGFLKAK